MVHDKMRGEETAATENELRQRARQFRDMARRLAPEGLERAYTQAAEGLEREANGLALSRAIRASGK